MRNAGDGDAEAGDGLVPSLEVLQSWCVVSLLSSTL